MDEFWRQLVREALEEAIAATGDRPVSGARLSPIIKRRASAAGREFPPPPLRTFSKFLDFFQDIAVIQTRPGRDLLIAPADRPELLYAQLDKFGSNRIRDDLFEAFTRIPKNPGEGEPYYVPSSDEVVWFTADTPKPEGALKFPVATFESEIAERKNFINSTEINLPHETRSKVSIALEDGSPLGSFSKAARDLDIAFLWHQYRMASILTRLRRWSTENNVQWNPDWIAEKRVTVIDVPAAEQITANQVLDAQPDASVRDFFEALSSVVSNEDLARIKIPMDLIAKAWSTRRG